MAVFLTVGCVELLLTGTSGERPGTSRPISPPRSPAAPCSASSAGFLLVWLINRLELAAGLYPVLAMAFALFTFGGAQVARRQRVPRRLSRRTGGRQPAPPRNAADRALPRRPRLARADGHVRDAGPPRHALGSSADPDPRGADRALPGGVRPADRGGAVPAALPLRLERARLHRLGGAARRGRDLPRHDPGARRPRATPRSTSRWRSWWSSSR